MRVALLCGGLALVLASGAWSQIVAISGTAAPEPQVINDAWPVPVIWSGAPASSESTQVVRVIRVNYLDIRMLCEALGGSYIDLRPLYAGYGGQGQASVNGGAVGNGLNRNAPLSQFVPQSIHNITGIDY